MDLTAFGPYALNVRTNISSYGPRARLIRAYYALNKHYLNIQTISGIKYFCLRGVPGTASNSEIIEQGGSAKRENTMVLNVPLERVSAQSYQVSNDKTASKYCKNLMEKLFCSIMFSGRDEM